MSAAPISRFVIQSAVLLALPGCAALGGILDDLATERPPAALDQATIASDARLDSTGRVVGSFVGEGTYRQVHLLSRSEEHTSEL